MINFNEIEKKLDEVLSKETKESWQEFLMQERDYLVLKLSFEDLKNMYNDIKNLNEAEYNWEYIAEVINKCYNKQLTPDALLELWTSLQGYEQSDNI